MTEGISTRSFENLDAAKANAQILCLAFTGLFILLLFLSRIFRMIITMFALAWGIDALLTRIFKRRS